MTESQAAAGEASSSQPGSDSDAQPPDTADAARLGTMLDDIAAISEVGGSGVSRLAYTAKEREAHDLVGKWFTELGLSVRVDAIGNTIAELPGAEPGLPAIGTGSHLDSVPHGGRFDGIAGVVAAVEAARLLTGQPPLRHPVRFVAFAAEEGARFGQSCLGSKGVAGLLTERDLHDLRDAQGISVGAAMTQLGFNPGAIDECRWSSAEWAAFVELHVEQGSILEDQGLPVGVVDLVSGSTRIGIECTGRPTHSGSTPMNKRQDALLAAAEIVLLVESIVTDPRHRGARGTVGVLNVEPGSMTTIPGRVYLTVDIRDVDSDRQRSTAQEVVHRAHEICDRRRVAVSFRLLGDASPVVLPVWVRHALTGVCKDMGETYRVMGSGASHDCQMVNQVVPSGLIFVPSRGGLSHVPEEWTSSADLATGVDVLVRAIKRLDEDLFKLARSSAVTQ